LHSHHNFGGFGPALACITSETNSPEPVRPAESSARRNTRRAKAKSRSVSATALQQDARRYGLVAVAAVRPAGAPARGGAGGRPARRRLGRRSGGRRRCRGGLRRRRFLLRALLRLLRRGPLGGLRLLGR